MPDTWVVVGLDNGGTCNNATVLDSSGKFLVDRLVETPSRVTEGPEVGGRVRWRPPSTAFWSSRAPSGRAYAPSASTPRARRAPTA